MKGIILAGGTGSRLFPVTKAYSKQLMYIYDKPMIYYPLSTLILGGIREILIICTPHDLPLYQTLLGDGHHLGLRIEYKVQAEPRGIAQAFLIGEEFIAGEPVCLILGDNLFYGYLDFFRDSLQGFDSGATVFAYVVRDPRRYGVIQFDRDGKVMSIEEKPAQPKSNFAIPGLYIYDNHVSEYAKTMTPSARGELEITDLNRVYLEKNELRAELIGRGVAWLDTGTPQALLEANSFIGAIEMRQGLKIGCLEEAALRMGFLQASDLRTLIGSYPTCEYKAYLERILPEFEGDAA